MRRDIGQTMTRFNMCDIACKEYMYVKRYVRVGYNLDIMRQSACLVFNPITVCGCGFLFGCAAVGQASDSMAALAWSFGRWVGA